jgi:opacity protein-like surface antigen
MTFMRSFIAGAVIAVCLSSAAMAQQNNEKLPMQQIEDQKKKDAEAIDRQYKSTLDRVKKNAPTTETRAADPWQNMRGADDSKTKR